MMCNICLYIIKRLVLWGLGILFPISVIYAQFNEPPRFQLGGSIGVGGVHTYLSPSLDIGYGNTTLRISPGLFFIGVGISHKIGLHRLPFSKKVYPLVFSFYYLDDYLLSDIRRKINEPNQRRDLDVYMVMGGLHFQLDRLDRFFWEAQIGMMYIDEKFHDYQGVPTPSQGYFRPMIEFKIGGKIQFHQNYTQKIKK